MDSLIQFSNAFTFSELLLKKSKQLKKKKAPKNKTQKPQKPPKIPNHTPLLESILEIPSFINIIEFLKTTLIVFDVYGINKSTITIH